MLLLSVCWCTVANVFQSSIGLVSQSFCEHGRGTVVRAMSVLTRGRPCCKIVGGCSKKAICCMSKMENACKTRLLVSWSTQNLCALVNSSLEWSERRVRNTAKELVVRVLRAWSRLANSARNREDISTSTLREQYLLRVSRRKTVWRSASLDRLVMLSLRRSSLVATSRSTSEYCFASLR